MGSAFEVITMCPAIIRLREGTPGRRSRDGRVSATAGAEVTPQLRRKSLRTHPHSNDFPPTLVLPAWSGA